MDMTIRNEPFTGTSVNSDGLAAEFEALVRKTYNCAYNAAFRMMGNAGDAEDLTQEAFIRIWRAFDRYNRSRSFEGWLFRILNNLAIDKWRRQARASLCSLDAATSSPIGGGRAGSAEPGSYSLMCCLSDERPSVMPEMAYLQRESGMRVRRALLTLPCDYRRAVLLADVKGYSYEEIAQHVGCPVGTIRSRLHRGRQLLRQTIKQMQEMEEGEAML